MCKLIYLVAVLTATAVIALPANPGAPGCQVALSQPATSTVAVYPLPTGSFDGPVFRGYSSPDCNEANFVGQYELEVNVCYNLTVAGAKRVSQYCDVIVLTSNNCDWEAGYFEIPYNTCSDVRSYITASNGGCF